MGRIKNAIKRFFEYFADKTPMDKITSSCFWSGMFTSIGAGWFIRGVIDIIFAPSLFPLIDIVFGAGIAIIHYRRYRKLRKMVSNVKPN